MTDKLNLPEEFWGIWDFIQRSFENKTVRHQGEIKEIFITVEKVLIALSDARDENKRLCDMVDSILNEWEGQCAVFEVGDYEDQKKYWELLEQIKDKSND